jgi:hypothetical protein
VGLGAAALGLEVVASEDDESLLISTTATAARTTTAATVKPAMTSGPRPDLGPVVTNGCSAPAVCRSATNDSSSPSVAAVVAALTRCRCSSIESWPSAKALSRIWQVAVRSLSFARVPRVYALPRKKIVRGRTPSPQTDADAPAT